MGKQAYVNDRISSGTYTDLAGNEGRTYPEAGELRAGDSASFEGSQPYNQDGTQTDMPGEGERLSSVNMVLCDICGVYVDDKKRLKKQGRYWRCPACIDKE